MEKKLYDFRDFGCVADGDSITSESNASNAPALQPLSGTKDNSPSAAVGNVWDDPIKLKLLDVSPEMIKAGVSEAQEYSFGTPLEEVVREVYLTMLCTMFRQNPQLRIINS